MSIDYYGWLTFNNSVDWIEQIPCHCHSVSVLRGNTVSHRDKWIQTGESLDGSWLHLSQLNTFNTVRFTVSLPHNNNTL